MSTLTNIKGITCISLSTSIESHVDPGHLVVVRIHTVCYPHEESILITKLQPRLDSWPSRKEHLEIICVQLASYLQGGALMWMMPLHQHVNEKSDYDNDVGLTEYALIWACVFIRSNMVCVIGPDKHFFVCKIGNIFLSIDLNICFGFSKRTVSRRWFFWVPTTYVLIEK